MRSHEFNRLFAEVTNIQVVEPGISFTDLPNKVKVDGIVKLTNTTLGEESRIDGKCVVAVNTPLGPCFFEAPDQPMVGMFIHVKAIMPKAIEELFEDNMDSISYETLKLCVKSGTNLTTVMRLCV